LFDIGQAIAAVEEFISDTPDPASKPYPLRNPTFLHRIFVD